MLASLGGGCQVPIGAHALVDGDRLRLLGLVASPDGAHGSVTIHADASLYAGLFDGAESATLKLNPLRKCCVHLVRGTLLVNGATLTAGDAALIEGEALLALGDGRDSEVLVFELAP